MYTATVKQHGKAEVTHMLKERLHRRAKEEAANLLPKQDGAKVVVERKGLVVGEWECTDNGRAVWSTDEDK